MNAIIKREFRALFNNVVGWVFLAAIMAVYGLYFYVYNLRSGYPYISYSLSAMGFLVMIAVCVLTMRIMSEDRKNRTDQLVLTAPVSLFKVVLGKFIAMGAVFSIAVVVIALTPLVLSWYGDVPMGESYTAVLGFWLFGLTCIAIGEFVSSLTESQIISAVVSFVLLFIGYMMNSICSLISEGGSIVTKILKCYDIYSPLGTFMAGTLDLTSVVYFVTLIILILFLTTQVVEKRRWSMSVKKISLGAFSIVTIIFAIAACWGINYGVSKIPTEYTSIDVTDSKLFKITDETKNYVSSLDQDITIYVWGAEVTADTTVAETLSRYGDMSSHIKVKYISPTESPDFYSTYTDEEPSVNSLIVVGPDRSKVVDYDNLYVYSYDYETYSRSIDAYDAEGQITSAIGYVLAPEQSLPSIYMLANHGEITLGSTFTQAIEKANINAQVLDLLTIEAVPEDCQLLIINGASSDLSKDDVDKIKGYLTNGGTVLLTTTYDVGEQPNMDSLLGEYGITKNPGVVMENDSQRFYGNVPYYLLPELVSNTYTSGITNGYVFMPYSAGLTKSDDDAYDYMELLATSDSAVAKTNTETATTAGFEEGDIKGPFYLGLSAMKSDEPGTLIVFSSTDVFTDDANGIVAGSNVQLFTGVLNKHISEGELELPVIASKAYTVDNLVITSFAGVLVGLVIMIVLPIMFVVAGIMIWAMRRKR